MSILGTLGSVVGSVIAPGIGTAIGGGLGSLADSAIGGGSSGGGGGQGGTMSPAQSFYNLYGAQAAAQNVPLTAAMQGLSVLQGAFGGALGLQATTEAGAQLAVLKEAIDRAQKQTATQASITGNAAGAGIDLLKNLGYARLNTELAGPTLLAQAGSAALSGENALAKGLAATSKDIQGLQEQTRAQVAQKQADTLANVFSQRAATEGALALGAQSLESGLKLQQAKTISNLQNIRAQTQARLAEKRFGAGQALNAQRWFA
jgi:hypothetical protein